MPAILFVEDDDTIAMGVEYSLKQDGFQVSLAYRLKEQRYLRTGNLGHGPHFTVVRNDARAMTTHHA